MFFFNRADNFNMNKLLSLFFLLLFLMTLGSCGADKLKGNATSSALGISSGQACGCNFSYSPVCGNDGRSYDNSCIAQCFSTTVKSAGHCVCSDSITVCGNDGQNYPECTAEATAKVVPGFQITKYVPCANTSY